VEGFAKECAVVTHSRLEVDADRQNETIESVERAARGAADERDNYRRELRKVGAVVS